MIELASLALALVVLAGIPIAWALQDRAKARAARKGARAWWKPASKEVQGLADSDEESVLLAYERLRASQQGGT